MDETETQIVEALIAAYRAAASAHAAQPLSGTARQRRFARFRAAWRAAKAKEQQLQQQETQPNDQSA